MMYTNNQPRKIMESKTKNKKSREQIERMARRVFGGTGLAADEDAVRELKEGWFNAAYDIRLADGREVILKIAPPQAAEVMQYENLSRQLIGAAMTWLHRSTELV
jgi:hypothetical protein